MNTLREILQFIGVKPNYWVTMPDGTGIPQPAISTVGKLIRLNGDQKTSMQAMILLLQSLPPFGLEAVAEQTTGEEPFVPKVRVNGATGVVIETRASVLINDSVFMENPTNFGATAGTLSVSPLSRGLYTFRVTRVGISAAGSGVSALSVDFRVVVRAARPVPPPDDPPPPPRTDAVISVVISSAPFPAAITQKRLTVSGYNFASEEAVTITIVYRANQNEEASPPITRQTTADALGLIAYIHDVECGYDSTRNPGWKFTATGTVSGKVSNQAAANCF